MTQYESIIDTEETLLEKWLLHEANEVYNYYSCMEYESDPRIRDIWEQCCSYELGHMHYVAGLFQRYENRDPAEVLPEQLPEPINYDSHREFVRKVLREEVDFRANGPEIVHMSQMPADSPSDEYRERMNRDGSPSETAAAGYIWVPGTELVTVR